MRLYAVTPGRSKHGLDEPKEYTTGKVPLGYHPKMGCYPDLYNHSLN